MEQLSIKSFDEYLSIISRLTELDTSFVLFRGQSESKPLLPSIARKDHEKNTVKLERNSLEELRRRTASKNLVYLKDDWDLLVFAQHYRLKTRLLDWTSNPIAAIWFACNNDKKSDAYVYVFFAGKSFILDKKKDPDPFTIAGTKILKPPQNNERIIAQSGWFTAHPFSNSANKFVPLETNNRYRELVYEIKIPVGLKPTIVKKCNLFGINNQAMFPDMEGICRQINWEYNL